ncbi:MAG: tetratricopeptide repeat protein [Elusimicrobiaceae bacterium]
MKEKFLVYVLLAVTMAAAAFAMWPSSNNDILGWDDNIYVTENPAIRDSSPSGIERIFTQTHYGLYKPVVILSFALNYRFSGLNPRPYHITNIVLHTVNTALVFWLIVLLAANVPAAAITALVFAVHPMHVESVAWVTERKDMLYSLFFLLSSILYLIYLKRKSPTAYIGSVLCFALSLTAKPMGITLPAVLFIYDYLLGRTFDKKLFLEKITYIAVTAVTGILSFLLLTKASQIAVSYTVTEKFFFVFYGLKFYVSRLFYPANLSALYPFPDRTLGHLPYDYYLAPVTVIGTALLLWKYFRHNRPVMGGLMFYIVTLAPVLQIVSFGPAVVADRYTYIPYIGLLLPISVYAARYGAKLLDERKLKIVLPLACAAALLLSVSIYASRKRCEMWKDNITLWYDAASKYPSIRTLIQLGGFFANDPGMRDEAEKTYKAAVQLAGTVRLDDPQIANVLESYCMLAVIEYGRGETKKAETTLSQITKLTPNCPTAWMSLGEIAVENKQYEKALVYYAKASASSAHASKAYSRMGNIYITLHNPQKAKEYFSRALELNPDNKQAKAALSRLS